MPETIADLDVVALLRDLPSERLERGQTGTVVLTHGDGEAYEVEFISNRSGAQKSIVATVLRDDLLKLKEYKHAPADFVA